MRSFYAYRSLNPIRERKINGLLNNGGLRCGRLVIALQMTTLKLTAALVLYLFLPLTALTYYFSRRRRRIIEVERILTLLRADPAYRQVHEAETLRYYLWAVAYASAVACAGLALLFFSREVGLPDAEFPGLTVGGAVFP